MARKIIVSLVSDQTIPNIELINEFKEEVDGLLFITTKAMEQKGNRDWIVKVTSDKTIEVLDPIVVNPFSFEDIEEQLSEVINDKDYYIVNLTGGTKVMSLAAHDFFKTVNAEMYYLTGRSQYIKVHPGRSKPVIELETKISLKDYMMGYGFEINEESVPLKDYKMSQRMLEYFLNDFDKSKDVEILNYIRSRRSRSTTINSVDGLKSLLDRIGFKEETSGRLTKYENRYLSGDWLEEYLYFFLKEHLKVEDDEIGLGWKVTKNESPNEFDVLVMRDNKLYLFECKTSIYIDYEERQTFITETIYKSDSLRNKLGLFAQTIVFTLSDLTKPKLKDHLDRANASRVILLGKNDVENKEVLIEKLRKI
mgnify:CR=1 FL=1